MMDNGLASIIDIPPTRRQMLKKRINSSEPIAGTRVDIATTAPFLALLIAYNVIRLTTKFAELIPPIV